MGVPAFFRWLSRKYPSVVAHCVEVAPRDEDGKLVLADGADPNPNGVEFDNLYLDMNGIIHPCTHPENKPAPKDEDEMMVAIFECIDRLLRIVRPRKLLYMAIDGVAPRAKMNQQRSRRFRASKEAEEKAEEIKRIRADLEEKGAILPPLKSSGEHFDSNCITPGTPFMSRLSECLHYYAHSRLNTDPAWEKVKIILSDASVPGEGEHKIMDFIRKQRAQPDHDPNTSHCLCGADADLIMLGLATHEAYFTIIREEFRPNQPRPCDVCGQFGHEMKDCTGMEPSVVVETPITADIPFIFVRLNVLREYLKRELEMTGLPFEYDFERVIDDWVLMCFFVGNDFLPHLPSLEIREGAIDRLIGLYKNTVYKTGGYLTDNGNVNLDRVQLIMSDLGVVEDEIFKKRKETDVMFKERNKAKKRREKRAKNMMGNKDRPSFILGGQYEPTPLGQRTAPVIKNPLEEIQTLRAQSNTKEPGKRLLSDESEEEADPPDEVRLWETGFKDRYYQSKFDMDPCHVAFRHHVAWEYVKGICWVLQYYYQGCPSWEWFFPFHYAPFASDFVNIAAAEVDFEKGTIPFKPLEQLMGVFPAGSRSHVPAPWAELMVDPDSDIIDFYPEDFSIDLNGKKFAWQGVALLPFVEEQRLFKALEPLYDKLTDDERKRNIRGDERLYVNQRNPSYSTIKELYNCEENFVNETSLLSDGVLCRILLSTDCVKHGASLISPVRGLSVVRDNRVLCVRYRDVEYGNDYIYKTERLSGVNEPADVLAPRKMSHYQAANWRPQIGMAPATQVATLTTASHRMVGHYTGATRIRGDSNQSYRGNSIPFNYGNGGRSSNNQQYGYSSRPSYNNGHDNKRRYPDDRSNNNNNNNNNNRYQGGQFGGNRGGRDWDNSRTFRNQNPYSHNAPFSNTYSSQHSSNSGNGQGTKPPAFNPTQHQTPQYGYFTRDYSQNQGNGSSSRGNNNGNRNPRNNNSNNYQRNNNDRNQTGNFRPSTQGHTQNRNNNNNNNYQRR